MKLLVIALVALMVNAVVPNPTVKGLGSRQGGLSYSRSEHNEEVVLDNLQPVLKSSGYAGRLYYAGQCAAAGADFVSFPAIEVHKPIGGGFRAIESIFRGDNSVTVSRKAGKVVSIRIGQVSTAVLQVRLPVYRLASLAQYNPSGAIGMLLNTPEVKAAMARLQLYLPLVPSEQFLAQPAEGLPHMPSVMQGMTADQILDAVAVTFQGIVVYGICPESKTRTYTIDFVGLD